MQQIGRVAGCVFNRSVTNGCCSAILDARSPDVTAERVRIRISQREVTANVAAELEGVS